MINILIEHNDTMIFIIVYLLYLLIFIYLINKTIILGIVSDYTLFIYLLIESVWYNFYF